MTIKFTFTKQDYDAVIRALNFLGVLTDDDVEQADGCWPDVDKEIDGNELIGKEKEFKHFKFALILAAFKTLENEKD